MQRQSAASRRRGERVALVPTMGALHAGHAALIRAACRRADRVIVSIFVNPVQFNDPKDFEAYPRGLKEDIDLTRRAGADLLFVPDAEEIYPSGFGTFVEVEGVTARWEGERRPGHFRGVTTVVAKLFSIASPDLALFGRKDYQQSVVIRKMVRELNLPVRIVVAPTVRDPDGLAISSRNVRLSAAARAIAPRIYQSLRMAEKLFQKGERNPARLRDEVARLLSESKEIEVDYVALCDPESLEPVDRAVSGTVVLIAARIEGIRLIDNLRLS
jgi:pantoate--beta-alanine ligase